MLRYQEGSAPRSIYTHIRQLMPGCMLRMSLADHASRHVIETPYWRIRDVAREGSASLLCLGRRSIEGPGGCAPPGDRRPDGGGCSGRGVPLGWRRFLDHRRADAAACVATCKDLYNRLRRSGLRRGAVRSSSCKTSCDRSSRASGLGGRRARRRTACRRCTTSPSPIPRRSDEPHLRMARKHVTVALSRRRGRRNVRRI